MILSREPTVLDYQLLVYQCVAGERAGSKTTSQNGVKLGLYPRKQKSDRIKDWYLNVDDPENRTVIAADTHTRHMVILSELCVEHSAHWQPGRSIERWHENKVNNMLFLNSASCMLCKTLSILWQVVKVMQAAKGYKDSDTYYIQSRLFCAMNIGSVSDPHVVSMPLWLLLSHDGVKTTTNDGVNTTTKESEEQWRCPHCPMVLDLKKYADHRGI